MASDQDPAAVYGEEDLDEDDVESEEDLDDEDSTSSSNLAAAPPFTAASEVTIAVSGIPKLDPGQGIVLSLPDPKRQRIESLSIATVAAEEKKPPSAALDESRKLFQRLWTDEDEIELLRGFLDYNSSSHHHHDTTVFYDQIKSKLQLDFNKNQLVEKLRRLKKKYRNVVSKMGSGKEYFFKSPHDQATFDISRKIWGGVVEEGGLDDDTATLTPNPTLNPNFNLFDHKNNGVGMNSSEKKRSQKRSRVVKIEEENTFNQQPPQSVAVTSNSTMEETVRSCLSPLFKELVHNAMNGASRGGFGGLTLNNLNPTPLFFGGHLNSNTSGDMMMMMDEKWRKQHILELEVYSKRLELVQDQINSALQELKSMGG